MLSPDRPDRAEILWDAWGVPHVFSPDDAGVFRAFGWAQMHAHGDLLLRLYGLARGRAAEYWGERYLESDRVARRVGFPRHAEAWWAAQSSAMRVNLEAFAAGVNAHAQRHPGSLSPDRRPVLPVTPRDVLAHLARVSFNYLATNGQRPMGEPPNPILSPRALLPDIDAPESGLPGSNAWAVGPEHSASGHAMLLANPHLAWGDAFTFFEAHLKGPEFDLYGVAQVGSPILRYGFSDRLGWAHTVNTHKGWDAYALTPAGDGYLLDGEVRPFERRVETLKVRRPDVRLAEERLELRRTVHGPVLAERDGRPIAVRAVGFEVSPVPGLIEQYWAMGKARDLVEFEAALRRMQNPMFNVVYADRDGHTMLVFGGLVPRRPGGAWRDWAGTLPGDTSATLWHDVHPYEDLPRVVDPPGGWVQSANSPPWQASQPPTLNPAGFPAYLAPRPVGFREQRSARLIGAAPLSLDDLLERTGSTRSLLAERLVPALAAAARRSGGLAGRAAVVLERWDRAFEPESRGAALFSYWVRAMKPASGLAENLFADGWDPERPLETPERLTGPAGAVLALEVAAARLLERTGRLDPPWGELTRFRRGPHDRPGHGAVDPMGVFRVSGFRPAADGRFEAYFGTTYLAAVEFSTPVRARVLLAYGNASQPGSPHLGDQLPLLERRETRPAWRTREEIEANLERRELV